MLACKSGYLDLVRALLNEGADIDAQDHEGVTAFGHAITSEKGENIGLIELLLDKGVDVAKGKFEWHGESESERRRIRPDKKIKGFSGIKGDMGSYSEIHKKKKFYEKSGRNLRGETKSGKKGICGFEADPVGIAIRRKFEAVAIKLFGILKNFHKKDSFSGNSYLHLAVFHQNWKVVSFLLKKGLKPNEKNNHDKTVFDFCQDEVGEEKLRSVIPSNLHEPNFKKKKFKKNKKKRKKKKPKGNLKEKAVGQDNLQKINISIDPSSSQNASSKGGFLLSQLSITDNQSNKLLNDISAQNSSTQTNSKTERTLLKVLSGDSKYDLKNNLSTDKSTQDLNSVYAKKKGLKVECRKLEIKLNKLRAENEFITTEDAKGSWSMDLERKLSDSHRQQQEDSLMSDTGGVDPVKPVRREEASAGKLLDIISNPSIKSGIYEKKVSYNEEKSRKSGDQCKGCLQVVKEFPCFAEVGKLEAQLGAELLEFEQEIKVLNAIIKPKYVKIQKKIEQMIKEIFKGPFDLQVYGSIANGLNIPGSDLDLLLIFNNSLQPSTKVICDSPSQVDAKNSKHRFSEDGVSVNSPLKSRKYTELYFPEISQQEFQNKLLSDSIMEDLNEKTIELPHIFTESKFLRNAQVPVIKMQVCPSLGGFPVDVTVHDLRHQGLECVDLVRRLVERYPPLKPIALVLKQLLNVSGLSDPYLGGLSSYGLVIMIVAYFQILEFREMQKDKKEEQDKKTGWGEDSRQTYPKGSRRHSRVESFNNISKIQKGNPKNLLNLNGQPLNSLTRGQLNRKKQSKRMLFDSPEMQKSSLFARSSQNIGKLLIGFLYFFGFEFNMFGQKIRIFLENEDPQFPIQPVYSN